MVELSESEAERARTGLAAALTAYLTWGLLPFYLKAVDSVPALEILAHRVAWAIPFGALIIALRGQWGEVRRALTNHRTLLILLATSGLIAVNWLVYIYAVVIGQVFQGSLGYYINPLMNVAVGVLFFQERLRNLQTAAVLFAAIGVAYLTFGGGQLPWISLVLAVSFTAYGVIRKQIAVGALPGLFVETLVLVPVALLYLAWLLADGSAVFLGESTGMSLLLTLAGPLTVVPLLMFAIAARRLQLTTIGILQFIAPTIQFLIGVYYGEVLTSAHVVCFSCIWLAISLFAWDAWTESRRIQELRAGKLV